MGSRGRRSAADLAVIGISLEGGRPEPPDGLPVAEAEVWTSTVSAMPARWFNQAHVPLLSAFCRHVVRANRLAKLVDAFDRIEDDAGLQRLDKLLAMAERESRAVTACARAMRITHQAQSQPRGAGRATVKEVTGPRPWEFTG